MAQLKLLLQNKYLLKFRKIMQFLKSNFLPILGLCVLLVFIALSYFHGALFLENLLSCGLLLGIIFLLKIGENQSKNRRNSGL